MVEFVSIVIVIFGILQVILFFKLWGMTNDVRRLTDHFLSSDRLKNRSESQHQESQAVNKKPEPSDNSSYLFIIVVTVLVVITFVAISLSI